MSVNLASTSRDTIHYAGSIDYSHQVEEQFSSIPIAQNHSLLRHILQTIDAQSCPRSYNFHMHTVNSDGQLQPTEVIDQALKIGLSGLAITDHHSVEGYYQAQAYLDHCKANQSDNAATAPLLWTGVEISADLFKTRVHILGYAFDPEAACLQPYLQGQPGTETLDIAQNVIKAIQQAGGLAVLAHPARYRSRAAQLIPQAVDLGIDGVEAYYNYSCTNPWLSTPNITKEIEHFAETYGLLRTCGTDTHGSNLLLRP